MVCHDDRPVEKRREPIASPVGGSWSRPFFLGALDKNPDPESTGPGRFVSQILTVPSYLAPYAAIAHERSERQTEQCQRSRLGYRNSFNQGIADVRPR